MRVVNSFIVDLIDPIDYWAVSFLHVLLSVLEVRFVCINSDKAPISAVSPSV